MQREWFFRNNPPGLNQALKNEAKTISLRRNVETMPLLTEEHHHALVEQGFCVVQNLVPPASCAAAIEALGNQTTPPSALEDLSPVQACIERVNQCVLEIFGDHYPCEAPLFVASLERPLSEENWSTSLAPHIDDAYPTIMPNGHCLQVLLYLSDVHEKEGAFVVFPQSYHHNRRWALAASGDLKFNFLHALNTDDALELPAPQGSAIFFHTMLHHSASANLHPTKVRQALLLNYHPRSRVVPGDDAPEKHSTLDRMYCTERFLERHGIQQTISKHTSGRFRAKASLISHASLRHQDIHYHLVVGRDTPTEIRVVSSPDLKRWHEHPDPIFSSKSPITQINFHWHREALLTISTRIGEISGVLIARLHFNTNAPKENPPFSLEQMGNLPKAQHAAAFHYRTFQGATQRPAVLFHTTPDDPRLHYLRANTYSEAVHATPDVSLEAPAPIEDFIIAPILGDSHFAALIHTEDGYWAYPSDLATQNKVENSASSLHYGFAPTRLVLDSTEGIHDVALYDRAGLFWLLSAIDSRDPHSIVWACIDWSLAPLSISTLRTPEELRRALQIVGLV